MSFADDPAIDTVEDAPAPEVRYTFSWDSGQYRSAGTTGPGLHYYRVHAIINGQDVFSSRNIALDLPALTEEKARAIALILNAPDNY